MQDSTPTHSTSATKIDLLSRGITGDLHYGGALIPSFGGHALYDACALRSCHNWILDERKEGRTKGKHFGENPGRQETGAKKRCKFFNF